MKVMSPVRALVLVAAVCSALAFPGAASGSSLPSGFRDDLVFSGLEEPTTLRFAPDGRVFVAEKAGRVLAYDSVDDPSATVFADLRTQVYDTGDRGLLGLALDPDFPADPYLYALYTYDHVLGEPGGAPKWGKAGQSGDGCDAKPSGTGVDACPVSGRLVRLTADEGGAGDHAVENGSGEAEEKVLVEGWCAQFSSHSIGDLEFDSDGFLYASGGEGGDANGVDYGQLGWPQKNQCGDPPVGIGGEQTPPTAEGGSLRAQDARTPANPLDPSADPTGLSGTLIRIDPDTGAGVPGNPMFSSLDPNERRIIAYGFRNPFRFAFDPAEERIYVGNVGWTRYEEIDDFALSSERAFNSGWPCYEGPGPTLGYQSLGLNLCKGLYAEPAATSPPLFYYRHGASVVPEEGCSEEEGSAVSGLEFYEDGPFPAAYDGALFFADAVRGCVYVMFRDDDGRPDPTTTTTFMSDTPPLSYPATDIKLGPDGDLYYTQLFGAGFGPGSVRRISYDPDAPVARLTASPEWGPTPLEDVELDAGGSSDPNGEPLSYAWDFEGDGTFTGPNQAKVTQTFGGSANVVVAVKVSDTSGKSNIARVTLYPDDTPPEPEIEEPSESLLWRVGQEVDFAGSAADQEEDGVENSGLFWKTRLYHCPAGCHAHPLQVFPAVGAGSFVAPDHDYPAHIEISLTAIDSRGLSATKAVTIYPRTVDLTIVSDPPGLELSAGLLSQPAPFDLPVIEGSNVVLSAPGSASFGGQDHPWLSWSDGGARVHPIVADQSATYTATYATAPVVGPPAPPAPIAAPAAHSPQTRIGAHPPPHVHGTSARFVFASDQPGSQFRCKLDRGPYKPCRSPWTYKNLKPGKHVLHVFAVSADGSADPTPAVFRWTQARNH
ncbi:MAG TPA: PQQ-dependent sugar dehydrogenase [Solirubrobacterales bacterium]|nr:PQQ-dependent sugar dehydrogenase [Solirubrobacterales bacterium]